MTARRDNPLPSRLLGWGGVLLMLWAGCGSCGQDEPATGEDAGAAAAPVETAADEADDEEDGGEPRVFVEHTVAPGQTLWEIARAYDVSLDELMEFNDLSPADIRALRKGAVLKVPGVTEKREVTTAEQRRKALLEKLPEPEDGAYHFIARGETLWDIARLYDKTADEIIAANDFSDDDTRGLRPGDPVLVPGIDEEDIEHVEKKERKGITHRVAYGETIWDLANAFRVSTSEIMTANGLSPEEVRGLREGTKLFIPGVEKDRSGKIERKVSPRQRRALSRARLLGLGTRKAASKLITGRVDPRWIRAAGGRRKRLPGTLRWPVTNGWYVRGYGSGAGGYHLAVDIMGEIGWNVRSAARGIVGYSGDGVRGYGNMVLVVHPGGWVTMYAHNSVNFVVAGERVPRGGILAEVGSTGISRGPHVHFELIHNRRNCDPARLFRPGIRHRDGSRTPLDKKVWRKPGDRPDAVDCARRRRHPKSRWVVNEDPTAGD